LHAQVERILASRAWSHSRQLRSFFRFVCEAALDGRERVDQHEIAIHLGRRPDFDPQQDTIVRKLASQARQKIDEYYATEGHADPVRVSLPTRSYVPHFELAAPPPLAPQEPACPPGASRRRGLRWALAGFALIGLSLAAVAWLRRGEAPGTFVVQTERGDFFGRNYDVVPEGLRLGPELNSGDSFVARLTFTPEMEGQQAGLLLWLGPDNFVRFGRRFTSRVMWEFAAEHDARFVLDPDSHTFDPGGQTGLPVWLALRYRGEVAEAFLSNDARHWNPVGKPLTLPGLARTRPRAGIYATNGRRELATLPARFEQVSIGSEFALSSNAPEESTTSCQAGSLTIVAGGQLQFRLPDAPQVCMVQWMRAAPESDFRFSTLLDFVPAPDASAGLILHGSKGVFRVVRGDTLRVSYDNHNLISIPDWPGFPPVYLRLNAENGLVSGSVSRDGQDFKTLGLRVPLREFGSNLRVGVRYSRSAARPGAVNPASFLYLRRELLTLVPAGGQK
jgi:plasmid stability protein